MLHQLDRIDVEDVLGGGVVAKALVVAGQAQQVAHAQGIRAQQIALDRQPVAVAAGHLDDRLQPLLHQRCRPAAMLDMRTMAVWLSVMLTASTVAFQQGGLMADLGGIGALGRAELPGDGKVSRFEDFFKVGAGQVSVARCHSLLLLRC